MCASGYGRWALYGQLHLQPDHSTRPTANIDTMFSEISGGVEQTYAMALTALTPGIVRDTLTAQPITNVVIAALGAANNGSSTPLFSVWPSARHRANRCVTKSCDVNCEQDLYQRLITGR